MLFHSLDFAVFLPCVLFAYWLLPRTPQNVLLLLASYFFYGYVHPWFAALLAASTLLDYSLARGMAAFPDKKRVFLGLTLTANLGLLGFFKYFGFFATNVSWALQRIGLNVSTPTLQLMLPVGISFYTFQSLSYTIDVYRGRLEARKNLLEFATFLALFPQLVAGPIERATHVLPQVESRRRFEPDLARLALMLMAWGFFKKIVVADNVAVAANKVFALSSPSFALVWVGTLAFSVQIYADFSAYSDIARGTARLLGFDLMRNFDHPYLAQTPGEFWRRWHISLSTWFRDYVYIPLGGNRSKHTRNILLTFLVSGLWHGASWNFALWGIYHGLLLVVYEAVGRKLPWLLQAPWLAWPRRLFFFACVSVGWLMFRETDGMQLIRDLTLRPGLGSAAEQMAAVNLFALVALYGFPLLIDDLLALWKVQERAKPSATWVAAEAGLVVLLVAGTALLASDAPSDFIYFQF